MRGVDYRNIFDEATSSTNLISGINMIAAEINLLLNHKKYTLFFGNDMGLDCERYIGLRNRVATFNLIRSDIEKLFKKYKRATIKKIDMSFNEENNAIDIVITASPSTASNLSFKLPFSVSS